MENHFGLGLQRIWFDRQATAELYRKTITIPGADRCTCISCKNFAAQRGNVFPEKFVEFLRELGIDPRMEWEAVDYDFDVDPSGHMYDGWFLFVGGLVDGGDEQPNPERQPLRLLVSQVLSRLALCRPR